MIHKNSSALRSTGFIAITPSARQGVLLLMVITTCIGCGRERFPKNPAIVPVGGVVTIDGEPTKAIKVVFATPEDVQKYKDHQYKILPGTSAKTDDQGKFIMTTTHAYDGLMPGDYIVCFEWQPAGVNDEFFIDVTPDPAVMRRLPPKLMAIHNKYSAGKEGNMPVKIETGKPQKELKFELKSK